MAVIAEIIHPTDINRRLLEIERASGAQVLRFALLMERAEVWTIDEIRCDSLGVPVAVTDDRGTAQERMHGVRMLEELLNSRQFVDFLCSDQARNANAVHDRLVDVMAMLRTGRFVVCMDYLSKISAPFMVCWLEYVNQQALNGGVFAHVLKERLLMIRRANLVRSVFSRKAVGQVQEVLAVYQDD